MKTLLKAPLTLTLLAIMLTGLLLLAVLPKADFSEMENRVLSQVDWRAGQIDRQMENWLADHFPFHDALVRLQSSLASLLGRKLQNEALIGSGGWLFEEPQRAVSAAASASVRALNTLAGKYDVPFSLMIVPTSAQSVDRLPLLYQRGDQQAVLEQIREKSRLDWIDTGLADARDAERYYYRTDHHLTAAGARVCYEKICAAWNLTPQEAEIYRAEGFLGTYWSKAPVLGVQADVFTADLPSGVQLTVDGEKREGLLQPERLQSRNKYAALIDSVYGHAILENPGAEGALLIIGDSYANALAPMLSRHFGRIDVVDPRYFAEDFSLLLEEAQTSRVLVYYGLNTFSVSRAPALLNR